MSRRPSKPGSYSEGLGSMRLMYGAPPVPGSRRSLLIDGDLLEPKPDPPPAYATKELEAFHTICKALEPLEPQARRRVLRAVAAYFDLDLT
jgi:hypothetical protein